MTRRRQVNKRKRAQQAAAKGEEPPDPFGITAAIIGSVATAAIGTGVTALSGGFKKPKAPAAPEMPKSPLAAGEDTKLKPGQKTNLINTTPQGVLEPATTGRKTLLGG